MEILFEYSRTNSWMKDVLVKERTDRSCESGSLDVDLQLLCEEFALYLSIVYCPLDPKANKILGQPSQKTLVL